MAENTFRIVREGTFYIVIPTAVSAIFLVLNWWILAGTFAVIAAFMAFFFRDPRRQPPADKNLVVSPADGRITRVTSIAGGNGAPATLVSIFLSPLNVHINRAPIEGKITNVIYTRGKFLMATDKNASLVNEQNALTIEGENITVVCKQIAGILARRIVCWKQPGDKLALGERFGLIKFSSRTDVLLPGNVEVTATEGQRVRGGTTVLGRIR